MVKVPKGSFVGLDSLAFQDYYFAREWKMKQLKNSTFFLIFFSEKNTVQ